MNSNECMKVLSVLQANYPSSYRGVTPEGIKAMVALWSELLEDRNYSEVMAAVKALMLSDASDFAPSIGKINNKILEMREAVSGSGMTAMEAWAKVRQAISRSIYYSEEEFKKLDDKSQRIIGSPSQLRAWAVGDMNATDTVVASNFMRSYNAMKENDRKRDLLPQKMLVGIEG